MSVSSSFMESLLAQVWKVRQFNVLMDVKLVF